MFVIKTQNDSFGYSSRSELVSASLGNDDFAYDFDEIGNRKTANEARPETAYTANSLNQYSAVGDFVPAYDADGNATLIKTATGTWQITYNGENRPIRFENAATRPLAINIIGDGTYFPTVDLTKNVCELVASSGNFAATYDYAPFGKVTATGTIANPLQFSSEVYDAELGLVYYNYRHYSPTDGRFLSRDPIEEQGGLNLYAFCINTPTRKFDNNGLFWPFTEEESACCGDKKYSPQTQCCINNERV